MEHESARIRSLEAEIGPGMVFARGFLLTSSKPSYVPGEWVDEDWAPRGMALWHDPRVPFEQARDGSIHVAVLGDMYSVDSPLEAVVDIASELARELSGSRSRFLERLDGLHGRYVVVVTAGGRTDLYHDATGMRTAYYPSRGGMAASHPALVALNTQASVRVVEVAGYGAPGLTTPYPTVHLLPPNQQLDVAAGTIQRYWPRKRIPQRGLDEVVEESTRLLRASMRGVRARHPHILASLTAGTDSRVTLAIAELEGISKDLEFFTYRWNNNKWIDRADQRIASEIAGDLGLRHSLISLNEEPALSPSMAAVLDLNAFRVHFRELASAYFRLYGDRDIVHVRSNLSEIMRTFYLKKLPTQRPRNGTDLAEIYRRSIRKGEEPEDEAWGLAVKAFEEMYGATDFRSASRRVDGRDLMYWEHRMGAWHGQVVLESDIAFDTLSLYNSRAVITTMLGASIDQRMDDEHMKEIIRQAPEDLMAYPLNPGPKRVKTGRDGSLVLDEEAQARNWLAKLVMR